MKAIEIGGWWYVVKDVWLRRVQTKVSQRPTRGAPPSFKYVKKPAYFVLFADGKPRFSTIDRHRFHSLDSIKHHFGEIKTHEDSP